jgi:hypothetical protein
MLHARRGAELGAGVALLGFVEVDYARNLNRYRRFRSAHELPLFKPRFRLDDDGGLVLLPSPFPGIDALARLIDEPRAALEAAPGDWFYDPLVWRNPLYDVLRIVRLSSTLASAVWRSRVSADRLYSGGRMNPNAEGFRLLVALVERFAAQCASAGQRAALVVFPSRDADVWGTGERAYAPLLDALAPAGIRVVDLADGLAAAPGLDPSTLWAPGRHYSAAGNAVVARALHGALRDAGWLSPR